MDEPAGVKGQAEALDRLHVARLPLAGDTGIARAADEAELPVPEQIQMLHHLGCNLIVIRHHVARLIAF
ncbi:hypothetical protein D3C75_396430 [compost metagenome]